MVLLPLKYLSLYSTNYWAATLLMVIDGNLVFSSYFMIGLIGGTCNKITYNIPNNKLTLNCNKKIGFATVDKEYDP